MYGNLSLLLEHLEVTLDIFEAGARGLMLCHVLYQRISRGYLSVYVTHTLEEDNIKFKWGNE